MVGTIPPDIRKIIDRGKLIVAMYHGDTTPLFMHDSEGRLYGVDIRLTEEIAAKLGVKVEYDCHSETFNEVVDTRSFGQSGRAGRRRVPEQEIRHKSSDFMTSDNTSCTAFHAQTMVAIMAPSQNGTFIPKPLNFN